MSDDRQLRSFCRRHRLTPHTVLFEGPYDVSGGLDTLFAAGLQLRESFDDLVIAAIPVGDVDARYRDRCERLALALGHRGLVEWSVADDERPLWRAAAAVICPPLGADEPPGAVAARVHSLRRQPLVPDPHGGSAPSLDRQRTSRQPTPASRRARNRRGSR